MAVSVSIMVPQMAGAARCLPAARSLAHGVSVSAVLCGAAVLAPSLGASAAASLHGDVDSQRSTSYSAFEVAAGGVVFGSDGASRTYLMIIHAYLVCTTLALVLCCTGVSLSHLLACLHRHLSDAKRGMQRLHSTGIFYMALVGCQRCNKEEGEQGMDAIWREVQVVREERAGEVLKLVGKVDEMSQQWGQDLDDQMSGLRVVLEATRRDVRVAREEGADEMRRVLGKAEEVGQQWGRGLDDDVRKLVGRMEEMQQRMEQRWREEFKHEVLTASLKEELGRTRREMLTAKEERAREMQEVMGKMEELKHSMILELRHEKEQVEKARREKEQVEKARREKEQVEKARREKEQAEKARREKEQAEKARREKEQAEKARREKEQAEKARREKEQAEKARREKEQAEKARREKEQWPQLRSKQLRDCIQYYFSELLEEEDDDSELMAEECQRRLEKWQLAEEFEHVFERAQGKRAEKVEKARERRRVEFRQTDWKQRKGREVAIDMKRERLQGMEIMTGEVEVGKVEEKKVVTAMALPVAFHVATPIAPVEALVKALVKALSLTAATTAKASPERRPASRRPDALLPAALPTAAGALLLVAAGALHPVVAGALLPVAAVPYFPPPRRPASRHARCPGSSRRDICCGRRW
ncbi:unnamed protein product [Closterium sp. Naga37s-1]|nr:unnamed protein product [Closterium sp. Naga37s-1]